MAQSQRSRSYVLIRQCLHKRIQAKNFLELFDHFHRTWPKSSIDIACSLVKLAFDFCLPEDPLVPRYIQALLQARYATAADFLNALIKYWPLAAKQSHEKDRVRPIAQMVHNLAVIAHNMSLAVAETTICIILSARWLKALFSVAANPDVKHNPEQTSLLVNAVGSLLLVMMNTPSGVNALKSAETHKEDPINVSIRQAIDGSMSNHPDVSMQLMTEAQKHAALLDSSEHEANDQQNTEVAAFQFESSIVNTPIMPTRVATYSLLYHKLMTSSHIDELAMLNYLSTRYLRNNSLMFNDILFASFDLLSKPTQSHESMYQAQCRIYLHNKLPSILAFIAAIEPLPTEQFLTELWNDLSTVANEDVITTAKHFLHVCELHHLISADAVQQLIGDDSNSTSAKGLFSKKALVEQVKQNASRGPRLVDELAKNDGNAGPISYAVVEIVHGYCQARETNHLKDMASALVRQPSTLNALGLFVRPSCFLSPICRLLDEWTWDDIHGESQPIYEEFGIILLLVVTAKFRLQLASADLGLASNSGFVAQYLSSDLFEKPLSEQEQKHLGTWLQNLYFEEGLSDEVTTNCSAKEFYLMVPQLLRQSMSALAAGKLSQEKLEAGLDYLLEPFLLPSLVSAFAWLARAYRKDSQNAAIILQRLTKSPSNAETSKLHNTILNIAHEMFRNSAKSDHSQSAPALSLLEERPPFAVNTGIKQEQLAAWMAEEGGIIYYLRRAISDLLVVPSASLYQPNVLAAAVQVRSPSTVAQGLIRLLVQFAANQDFNHLLDTIAAIIASADPTSVRVRNSLQLMYADLAQILKRGDTMFAQGLIHLQRRVELYAHDLIPHTDNDDQELMPTDGVDLAEINLDQMPMDMEVPKPQPLSIQPVQQLSGGDIDQLFNDSNTLASIEDYGLGNNNDNMFDDPDNYQLSDINDLDMRMFED